MSLNKKSCLLAIDRPDWAFDHIAQQVKRYVTEYDCSIEPFTDYTRHNKRGKFDTVVCFWWNELVELKRHVEAERYIVAVYDLTYWKEKHERFKAALSEADAIVAGNDDIAALARRESDGTTPVYVCEDGVDTSLFFPQPWPTGPFTVGWCGNSWHAELKGLDLIKEACEATGTPLRVADFRYNRIAHRDMAKQFFGKIHCYVCASECEGTPNPALETMACGRPLISTEVGLVPKLLKNRTAGLIVDRTADAIAEAITETKRSDYRQIGRNARREIMPWDWSRKTAAWRRALIGT